jgi:hypothetical protein
VQSIIDALQEKRTTYVLQRESASSSIERLNQYKADSAITTNPAALESLLSNFTAEASSGGFFGTAAFNDSQEDQVLLQSQLAPLSETTNTELTTCNAIVTPQPQQ